MHPTKNDLSKSSRTRLVKLLNARLADAMDLMLQAKEAHWNVKGPSFIALHELFDKVHNDAAEHVDLIAERAVSWAASPRVERAPSRRARLAPYPAAISSGRDHADALSSALARPKLVRAAIDEATELGDAGTADISSPQVSRATDQNLWFVEAHLEGNR
ncbi:MAG: DNA starvation/stationary phase protection protein Dps [Thermoanaerobaculia bacterium]